MARIREKLRHALRPAAPAEPAAEAVSFVEVGARRYFEASADVLAACPAPRLDAASTPPRPHAVALRGVPSNAAPRRGPAPELVAFHAPGQPASARYCDLLASLREAASLRAGGLCRSLLLTAAKAGVGATTVLLNLAVTAARQGLRVAVVDANLRRPALAERLGLPASPGLAEVLAGEAELEAAMQPTAQDGLSLLAAGAPTALLADEGSLRDVVQALAEEFDLVLVDGPRVDGPVPAAGRGWDRAASLLASACQAVFVVVPAGEAEDATAPLTAGLAARGLPLAGCIVAG